MLDLDKLCMRCMGRLNKPDESCPHCGASPLEYVNAANQLECGSILAGTYLVGCVLGQGGFGITYIGLDLNLNLKVAIKEYYPEGYVTREGQTHSTVLPLPGERRTLFERGKEKFVSEAQILAKFNEDASIVGVRGFFQENGTVYIVMSFVEGETLKEFATKRGGKIPVMEVLAMMEPLFESLSKVHAAGLLHRDISPDNIMRRKNGSIVLLDFGAARQMSIDGEHSNTINVKHGFAPEEQYRTHGEQGPWTDIYSLCATIYYLTTGAVPKPSLERMATNAQLIPPTELGAGFTRKQEKAILKGLSVRSDQRQQSIKELKADLFVDDSTGIRGQDSNVARNRFTKERNSSLLVKPRIEKKREEKGKSVQQELLMETPKENERSSYIKRVKLKFVIFGALMLTVIFAIFGIIAMVFDLIPIKQTIQDAFGKPTFEQVQDYTAEQTEDPLVVQAADHAVKQIEANKLEILQTVFQDDYLSSQTNFVSIKNIKPNYYEVDVHFPAPQYCADNALFANDDPMHSDGKLLMYYREEDGPVPITSVEDWEEKLANSTEKELAMTYAGNADYSAYRKMLQDNYESFAQQLIASDEYYDAFLVYVSCGNRAKTAEMGGQLLCFGRNNVGLCRNGKVLSTSFDTSGWTNIASFSVGQESIIGLCEDGSVKFAGRLTRYGEYDFDWQNVHKVYNFTNTVMAILNDGTVKSIGWLNEQGISDKDLYRNGWKNIVSIEQVPFGFRGTREDGSSVFISTKGYYTSKDYNVIQIEQLSSYQSFSAIIGLFSDGTVKVLEGSMPGGGELNKWSDIKTIMTNDNGVIGLRKDGTISYFSRPIGWSELSYRSVGLEAWTNVVRIYGSELGWDSMILGLRDDGTVIGAGFLYFWEKNEIVKQSFDLSRWKNIVALYPRYNRIIGLENDGSVIGVGTIDMGTGKGNQDLDLSNWKDVLAIYDEGECILGYTKDKNVIGVGSLQSGKPNQNEPLVLDNWSNIVCLYRESEYQDASDYILGLKEDGTVLATGIVRTGYVDGVGPTFSEIDLGDWHDIIYLTKSNEYIIGLCSDGTLVGYGDFDPEILKWDLW